MREPCSVYMEFIQHSERIGEMSFGDRLLETMNQELLNFPTNEYYHLVMSKNADHPLLRRSNQEHALLLLDPTH